MVFRNFCLITFLSYSLRTVTGRVIGLTLVLPNFPSHFKKMTFVLKLKDCRMFLTFSVNGTRSSSIVFWESSAIPCVLKLDGMLRSSDFTFGLCLRKLPWMFFSPAFLPPLLHSFQFCHRTSKLDLEVSSRQVR